MLTLMQIKGSDGLANEAPRVRAFPRWPNALERKVVPRTGFFVRMDPEHRRQRQLRPEYPSGRRAARTVASRARGAFAGIHTLPSSGSRRIDSKSGMSPPSAAHPAAGYVVPSAGGGA